MIDKPLPPAVFGEEPQYVAIRTDVADIRAPMTSSGLQKIHDDFLGTWTYLTVAEVMERINAQPVPPPPAPSAADTALADKLRRLQLSATAYANQVEVFTNALRKTIEQP